MKLETDNNKFEINDESTILEVLQRLCITEIESPCGGKGTCGKCTVTANIDGSFREVLACQTRSCDAGEVIIHRHGASLILDSGSCYNYPSDGGSGYAVATDIGTTTVVSYLIDLQSGRRVRTVSYPNAQRVYGADVVTRITACMKGQLEEMRDAIRRQLLDMETELIGDGEPSEIIYRAVAANTVMSHIFAGINPEPIGKAPYLPEEYFGREFDIDGRTYYIAPAVAGYVGGDITADILATRMHEANRPVLLLDIGTNGEIALGDKDGILTCATAAGPAFEGGEISQGMPAREGAISKIWVDNGELRASVIGDKATGICGSGLIDALAALLELEIIDETGAFEDEDIESYELTSGVYLTQADIRKLQLAKAALAAGINILLKERGIEASDIESLVLAGGFGTYLTVPSAALIGMFPDELKGKAVSVGNAAGEGAISLAISNKAREDIHMIKDKCRYIELSTHPDFTDEYMEAMYF